MNQKSFINIILVVVIIIFVGAVGYFAFVKKSEPGHLPNVPPPLLGETAYIPRKEKSALLKLSNRKTITKEINYGSGTENIGVRRGGEGANTGPASFAVDARGNIYISDTVNVRIQVRAPDGTFISSIQLKGQGVGDINIDKNGFIYVIGDSGKLYQYDRTGTFISDLSIDRSRLDSGGSMHIIDNSVYIGSAQGDVLIAHIEHGQLTSPSEQELFEPLQDGILGQSRRRYIVSPKIKARLKGDIEVVERDGAKSLLTIPDQGIAGIEFIGEDGKGNAYFKTQASSGGISVAVSRFDVNGNYLDTTPVPGNSYDFFTIKIVTVGEDGTVYQMMPAKDKLILRSFLAK